MRSDDEIDNYNDKQFKDEKKALEQTPSLTVVDYIRSSIEILMNLKVEDHQEEKERKELEKK